LPLLHRLRCMVPQKREKRMCSLQAFSALFLYL
jgi:hypothetical protein